MRHNCIQKGAYCAKISCAQTVKQMRKFEFELLMTQTILSRICVIHLSSFNLITLKSQNIKKLNLI